MRVDETSPFFLGHFPGDPILPGIALLGLVMEAVQAWQGRSLALSGLRDLRFRTAVRPGDGMDIHLSRTDKPGEVRFEVKSGAAVSSTGILVLAPARPTSGP